MSAPPLRLGDRYRVGDVIGRGGMADVYRAHDTVLDRSVAVKVLRDVNSVDAGRFADEAHLLASLDHPHIVRLLDAGVTDERPWIALELVEGTTLRELMRAGRLEAATAARIGRDVASALAHAHHSGVVHRDVKPANILLEADGTANLTDFGIARLDDGSAGVTATGFTVGTAAYLSPEQVSGEPMSSGGDVYALGLVLLEALTAVRAYSGPPIEAALARLTLAPMISTSLPTGWPALLTEMTYRDSARRPSAHEVARRLESARPLPAEEHDTSETAMQPASVPAVVPAVTTGRRPVALVAVAVLLVLATSLAVVRGLGEPAPAIAEISTETPAPERPGATRPAAAVSPSKAPSKAPASPAATVAPVAPVQGTEGSRTPATTAPAAPSASTPTATKTTDPGPKTKSPKSKGSKTNSTSKDKGKDPKPSTSKPQPKGKGNSKK